MQHPSALVPQFLAWFLMWFWWKARWLKSSKIISCFPKKGRTLRMDVCLYHETVTRHFLILVVFVAWPVWVHFPLNHGTESDSSRKAHLKTMMWCGVYQMSKLNLIGFIAIHLGIADTSTSKNAHVRSRNFCDFANQNDFSARAKYQLNA